MKMEVKNIIALSFNISINELWPTLTLQVKQEYLYLGKRAISVSDNLTKIRGVAAPRKWSSFPYEDLVKVTQHQQIIFQYQNLLTKENQKHMLWHFLNSIFNKAGQICDLKKLNPLKFESSPHNSTKTSNIIYCQIESNLKSYTLQ